MSTVVSADSNNLYINDESFNGIKAIPLNVGIKSVFGSYLFSVSSGVVSAMNLATGNIDYSNTDAAIVINSAISACASTGGLFFFQPGIYNINSLTELSSGYYYGIGIPGVPQSSQYVQWVFEGVSAPLLIDQFDFSTIQTGGVIFYVTPDAIASVSSSDTITAILQLQDTTNGIGPYDYFRNFGVRFPDNQRGNTNAVDVSYALMSDYENVIADFNIAQQDLSFPASGSYGLTTTASEKEENYMKNCFAVGYNVGLDIQSEHSVLINSYACNCNYGIQYGVRGSAGVFHNSAWLLCGAAECARALTLGSQCVQGSQLDILGFDIEDAYNDVPFAPVYHAMETNSGYTWGNISYTITQPQTSSILTIPLFDGGGGTAFQQFGYGGIIAGKPISVVAATQSGPSGSLTLGNGTATSATAGSETLPSAPLGFLTWNLGGTTIKIPYYSN